MPGKERSWFRRILALGADAITARPSAGDGPGSQVRRSADLPLLAFTLLIGILTLWPFNFWQKNLVTREPEGGLRFEGPSLALVRGAGEQLRHLNEMTLLVRFHSDEGQSVNYNTVFALEHDRGRRAMLLRRQQGRAIVSMAGLAYPLFVEPVDDVARPIWMVIRCTPMECAVFVNGLEAASERFSRDPFPIDEGAALIFGSEADGHFTWNGTLFAFAVLDRAVSDEEVLHPDRLLKDSSVVLRIPEAEGKLHMEAAQERHPGLLEIPERFAPFARTVLLSPALYFTSAKLYLSDIVLNVALFLPFGCLVAAFAGRRGARRLGSLLAAGACALVLSFSLEYAQAFLPSRFSSSADVLSNTAGGLMGAAACVLDRFVRPVVARLRASADAARRAIKAEETER